MKPKRSNPSPEKTKFSPNLSELPGSGTARLHKSP